MQVKNPNCIYFYREGIIGYCMNDAFPVEKVFGFFKVKRRCRITDYRCINCPSLVERVPKPKIGPVGWGKKR